MTSLAVRLAIFLLKLPLSLHDRAILVTKILDRLGALPFTAPIRIAETGGILLYGEPLTDVEKIKMIQESAKAALNNPAVRLMWDHIAYLAVEHGVHKAENELQVLWGRTALWNGQQERLLLNELAGNTE